MTIEDAIKLKQTQTEFDYDNFQVAIWWHRDGAYGGLKTFSSLEAAQSHAADLVKMGYGKPGFSEIHIWRRTRTTLEVTMKEPKP